MTEIVDRMLPDLIDVGGWGSNVHQIHPNMQNSNLENDHIKQLLYNSLPSHTLEHVVYH